MNRRDFIGGALAGGAAAFAAVPTFAGGGRTVKIPQMLDTKRMAIHDGPGIRTTFFVKGCPLHCVWCHNPESIKTERQTARFQHLCRHCSKCTMDEATCTSGSRTFNVVDKDAVPSVEWKPVTTGYESFETATPFLPVIDLVFPKRLRNAKYIRVSGITNFSVRELQLRNLPKPGLMLIVR